MPLGWETNAKYTVESESLRGESKLGMGNPRAPHPLYETLQALPTGPTCMLVRDSDP